MEQPTASLPVTTHPVTVLGLGPMGRAVAKAFLAHGHPTTVWNRTATKADALLTLGAVHAPTPAAAIAASPLAIVCLRDNAAVHATLDPVAEQLHGKTLVNLTSTSPQQARDTAAWAASLGTDYLAGAIMTPTPSIGQPAALVLYSGPEQIYQAHQQTLATLGGTATHLGHDPGRAAAYDVALLDIFWMSVYGIVHGIAVARAENIAGRQLAPYAQRVLGLLPEMMARFAQQADDRHYPGDRSTIASAAASIDHIIHTTQARRIDSSALAAFNAVVQRAVDAGYGADGLARLVESQKMPRATT
jgi:3-hydroxyisobutyrate dehydrogenase-like beta-hydroxyacid dehydrogenase